MFDAHSHPQPHDPRKTRQPCVKRRWSYRPLLETLEDRIVPALQFNFNPAPGMPQQAINGFIRGGQLFQNRFSDDVVVNVDIDFRPLGGPLGVASSSSIKVTYSQYHAAITADRITPEDNLAVASLQAPSAFDLLINRTSNNPNGAGSATPYLDNDGDANNTTIEINRANAKAIGLLPSNDSTRDASIAFASTFTWDFDPSDGIAPGAFDFVIVAAHEIGHALGFVSGVDLLDFNSPGPGGNFFPDDSFDAVTSLDLYRFSTASVANGSGVIDFTADNRTKAFSIDGGQTTLATFSTGVRHGDGRQASHWKDNLGIGMMDPTAPPPGQAGVFTALDELAFDVIGWDRNAPPILRANNATVTGDEGSEITNTGTFSDPNSGDIVNLSVDVGTITQSGTTAGSWTWTHTPPDGATSFQVTVTATDRAGTTSTVTFTVNVDNVSPTIALTDNSPVPEGQTYTLNLGNITDPGTDTVTAYTINWGDGSPPETFNGNPTGTTATHMYAAAGNYTVTVDLVDEDGTHIAAGTITAVVEDVPPEIALSDNDPVNEGSLYQLFMGQITDFGNPVITAFTIHWGDGTSNTIGGNPQGRTIGHVYADNGAFNVTVDLVEAATTTHRGAGQITADIRNVAPTIALSGADTADLFAPYTLNLDAVTDPGTDTVVAYVVNWGDGTTSNFGGNPTGRTAVHNYNVAGTITIRVDLIDEDGTHVGAGTKVINIEHPLQATLRDTLANDTDRDGRADPGDTIRYTAQITNNSDSNATNVTFASTLSNFIRLVNGSVRITPIAFNDTFATNTNGNLTGNLLTNDVDPDDPNNGLTIVAGSVQRIGGTVMGTLTPFADGSFNYTAPGQAGTETFEYFIEDSQGLQSVTRGILTINVSAQPLQLPPVSDNVDVLFQAQLVNILAAAKTRWAALGISGNDLAALDQLTFTLTDLHDNNVAVISGDTVYLDRAGAGHGWFVDVTPHFDEEYDAQAGSTILVAKAGTAAADGIDALSVVMQYMGRYLFPESVDQTSTAAVMILPGMRDVSTESFAPSQLSQLQRTHGFYSNGNLYENALGQREKWFQNRTGAWFTITRDGIIRAWNGEASISSGQFVAQVAPIVYVDLTFLFDAPIKVTAAEQQALDALHDRFDFRSSGTDYFNWGGAFEKWFINDAGDWFTITPDGTVRRADSNSVLSGSVAGRVTPLAFDNPVLLFAKLTQTEQQTLQDVQSQFGFYSAGDLYFNWGGAGEKWFQSNTGAWHTLTQDGKIRSWNGRAVLNSPVVAEVTPAAYDNLDLLFNAQRDRGNTVLSVELHQTVAKLRQDFGFYRGESEYQNALGQGERWFKGDFGLWFAITPDGTLYQWNGRSLPTSYVIANLTSAVHADLDALLKAQPALTTSNAPQTPGPQGPPQLTQTQLDIIVSAAIERWAAAGLTAEQRSLLENTTIEITNLSDWYLGIVSDGAIQIDVDGAGRGWFVDLTPLADEEFDITYSTTRLASSSQTDTPDLLTTVMHEMGHLLGLNDMYDEAARDNLMYGFLFSGERRLPTDGQAANTGDAEESDGLPMLSAVSIGTLPANTAVQVIFDTTVNNPLPAGAENVAVQGVVDANDNTGTNQLPQTQTDDPDTGQRLDRTVTPIDAAPDLLITAAEVPEATLRGDFVDFDFNYSNIGNQDATGAFLQVAFTGGVVSPSAAPAGWIAVGNGIFRFNIGNLAVGQTGTARFSVAIPDSATSQSEFTATGSISDDTLQGPDLDLSNNLVALSTIVTGLDDRRWS